MKTLKIFLGVGVVVFLLGLNTVVADIESAGKSLTFSLDIGDGSTDMPKISFDMMGGAGGQEAQTVCAMTPGGKMSNLLLEEPFVPPPAPVSAGSNSPRSALAQLNSLGSTPPPSTNRGGRRTPPPPLPPPPPPPIVPEPTTLLLVGFGVGTVLAARRRWQDA